VPVKTFLSSALAVGLMVGGCGDRLDTGAIQKKLNETNALAKLRQYQVAQNVLQNETGSFARRLPDLFQKEGWPPGRPGMIPRELAAAWGQGPNPVPLNGYLFADLTDNADGSQLDPHMQFGLCAYPAEPGRSGDLLMLILLDKRTMTISEDKPMSRGGHAIWARTYKPGDKPVTSWPSQAEFERDFVRLDRSVEDARALLDTVNTRKPAS
ncbi:MAG: hypothetical protein KGL03_09190, partial [Nitrospirota bacterium]|nr:hypothetical protein [Nitrospirota bacterium]